MNTALPIHLVVRFSDALMSVDDTIAEHQRVIKKRGRVWFAKVGKGLAGIHIERINRQCADGVKTFVILVQNKGRPGFSNYVAYKGTIRDIRPDLPEAEHNCCPAYYDDQNVRRAARLWIKLSDIVPMSMESLRKFQIASSKMAVPQTLRRSMAAIFVIQEGEGLVSD